MKLASLLLAALCAVLLALQQAQLAATLPLEDPAELDCGDGFSLLNADQKCDCAHQLYEESDGLLNYFVFHYCTMKGLAPLSVLVLLMGLVFFFYIMANTADNYLVPSLEQSSEFFNLSPNVAGVTLLAFGNGSPDLFTSLASFTSGDGDIGIGNTLGAGIFVTALILGSVCLTTEFTTFRRPFLRDVIFYIVAVFIFLAVFIDGTVYLWEGVLFLLWYMCYVAVVVVGRIVFQRRKKRKAAAFGEESASLAEPLTDYSNLDDQEATAKLSSSADVEAAAKQGADLASSVSTANYEYVLEGQDDLDDVNRVAALQAAQTRDRASFGDYVYQRTRTMSHTSSELRAPTIGELARRRASTAVHKLPRMETGLSESDLRDSGSRADPGADSDDEGLLAQWKSGAQWRATLIDSLVFAKRQTVDRLLYLFEAPFTVMRGLTIPAVGGDAWNPAYASLSMVFAPLLFLFVAGLLGTSLGGIPLWIWLGLPGAGLAIFLYERVRDVQDTTTLRAPYLLLFVGTSFVMSCMWTYLFANELVDLLGLFGLILGLSKSILGLTVLAWGNSIGDLVADVMLARKGNPRMAAAGCFGCPMFNLLIGLGFALLYKTATDYPEPFKLKYDPSVPIGFIFLMCSLFLSLSFIPINKFRFTKKYGVVLLVLYLAFLLFGILTENRSLPAIRVGNYD